MRLKTKQDYIFDMDGTLLDSMGCWFSLKHEMIKRHEERTGIKIEITKEDEEKFEGMSLDRTVKYINEKYLSDLSYKNDIYPLLYDFYTKECKQKPEAGEFLELLKSDGRNLGVITATPKALAVSALKSAGMDKYFSFVLTPEDSEGGKFKKDIFLLGSKLLKTKPSDICLIDDAEYAHITARSAGFRCIGIFDPVRGDDLKQVCDKLYFGYDKMIIDFKERGRL